VRNKDNRVAFGMKSRKQAQDLFSRSRVEVAGGFVGGR